MENSAKISPKFKIITAIWAISLTTGCALKAVKSAWRVFTLFSLWHYARLLQNEKNPSLHHLMNKENVAEIYLLSTNEVRHILSFVKAMVVIKKCYSKWKKSDAKRQALYNLTHKWDLKDAVFMEVESSM